MLEFNSLFESKIANVSNYCCTACRGGPTAEENSGGSKIVLMRHGVFCRHFGKQVVTSDVNHASFFSEEHSYRVSHPADCGDRGTVLSVSPQTLNDIIRELDPTIDDHPERPFPFFTGLCRATTFYRHHELATALESGQAHSPDSVWVEEKIMQLVADVLDSAFRQHMEPKKQHRQRTSMKHADLVESAKSFVASRIGEHLSLDEISSAVDVSPFHLSRVFRRATGLPLHRYLVCLRLRTSLEKLSGGANDLTSLALDLGFSSHGHFSDTFRREFGCPPSEARNKLTRSSILELSKNLEV